MLTPEFRAWAIEAALSHFQGRYVERVIREAPDDHSAIAAARREISNWGSHGPGRPSLMGDARGLLIKDRDWQIIEIISYREIVDIVRHPQPAQMTLF